MKVLEKFAALPVEKQRTIIDAGLAAFAANGYKKTGVSDIAAAAGISKAMVFHYFGTKKAFYCYLMELCTNIVIQEIEETFDRNITDFFDRIKMASSIKIAALEKHPALVSFMTGVFMEKDEEVATEIKAILDKGEVFRSKLAFHGMDSSKFKEGVDPNLVMKILVRYAEGFVSELPNQQAFDMEQILAEFDEVFNLLKSHLYKEEYL